MKVLFNREYTDFRGRVFSKGQEVDIISFVAVDLIKEGICRPWSPVAKIQNDCIIALLHRFKLFL